MRRRRTLLGVTLALAAGTTLAAAADLFGGGGAALGRMRVSNARVARRSQSAGASAVIWPQQGQAALVVGDAHPLSSPGQRPVPIASVTKVMTALLVLRDQPLAAAQDGFAVTITAAQAREEVVDADEDQSVAAVAPGERLTERQLLEALLIPSGNNIARLLAARVAGSDARFVAEMNAEARALGMRHTIYTDPSGWDAGTVSTAADQLRVLRAAMRLPVFRQIVSMASVTLPVAGTLVNTNPLISAGYFGKTGSDTAAGGCLAFFTQVSVGGRRLTAAGVVLGQWDGGSVSLAAAGRAAQELVASIGLHGPVTTTPQPLGPGGHPPGSPLG
jgi:D-alanyl-D-alanine carboxypeptidase (penicillin-binding protein 5/6)